MKRILVTIASLAALGLCSVPSSAADDSASHKPASQRPVELHGGWMHETTGDMPAEAYVTIENNGKTADKLLFITGPDVNHVAIDETAKTPNGADKATPVDTLVVPAGAKLALGPGQTHLVVFGLSEPLTRGKTLFLIFHFEHAGDVSAYFVVKSDPSADHAPIKLFKNTTRT
jgi:periplasmic copper chaperone A